MSRGDPHNMERLSELLADRAVQGLSAEEAAELDRLLAEAPQAGVEAESFDLAAAAIDRALGGREDAALPAGVRERVEAAATAAFARGDGAGTRALRMPTRAPMVGGGGSRMMAWGGWIAAAAAVLIAALGWLRSPGTSASHARSAALAAKDHVQWAWMAWGAKPANEGGEAFSVKDLGGEVTWSTTAQTGVMRLVGLPKNDPAKYQYQLWIIDPASQKQPIDGGVFNVDREGEVTVLIDPKLRVTDPKAFAITAEKPGGVVVSEQHRRVVIASPGRSKG